MVAHQNNQVENFITNYQSVFCINKLHIKTSFFVDSWSIMQMILGFRDADQIYAIDRDSTLVHGLFYHGLIGPCNLTIPHQKELLKQLEGGARFMKHADKVRKDEVFNKYVKEKIDIEHITTTKHEKEYILFLRDHIKDLYVANYLLKESNWGNRLAYLNEKKRIILDKPVGFDVITLYKNPLYKELKRGFDSIRSDNTINNSTDALVLCMMSEKLREYEESGTGFLPLYYDPSGIFREVIKKTQTRDAFIFYPYDRKNFKEAEITRGVEDPIFIIRDHEFFLINFLVKDTVSRLKSNGGSLLNKLPDNLLKYNQIFWEQEKRQDIELSKSSESYDPVIEIEKSFSNLIKVELLKRFWEGKKESSIKELLKSKYLPDETIKDEIAKEVNSFTNDLRDKLKNYILYNNIYIALDNALRSLGKKERLGKNLVYFLNNEELGVITSFGLTKFSIHPQCRDLLENTVRELLGEVGGSNVGLLVTILSFIRQGISEKSKREKLGIGLAVLWILGRYRLITEVVEYLPPQEKFNNRKEFAHYSNAFFYGGSYVKTTPIVLPKRNEAGAPEWKIRIDTVFECVQSYKHEIAGRSFSFEENYNTALAAAYVKFEIWKKLARPKTFLTRLKEPPIPDETNFVDQHLIEAVKLVENAIRWMKEDENYLRKDEDRKNYYYYLLNMYIYFITSGYDDSGFNKLGDEVGLIATLKPEESGWSHEFAHTLALYNLRRAMILKDTRVKDNIKAANFLLDFAKNEIERGLEYVLRVDDYQEYMETYEKVQGIRNNMFIGLKYKSN